MDPKLSPESTNMEGTTVVVVVPCPEGGVTTTCTLSTIGDPAIEVPADGFGPNTSVPWVCEPWGWLNCTPWSRVPGNAGITVLVLGPRAFGPIPKTPAIGVWPAPTVTPFQ